MEAKLFQGRGVTRNTESFDSLELSFALIEELTENDNEEFNGFYKEMRARVGRLPHIKENFICCATNPDAPEPCGLRLFHQDNRANATRLLFGNNG